MDAASSITRDTLGQQKEKEKRDKLVWLKRSMGREGGEG